jgi:hypothetical protein
MNIWKTHPHVRKTGKDVNYKKEYAGRRQAVNMVGFGVDSSFMILKPLS